MKLDINRVERRANDRVLLRQNLLKIGIQLSINFIFKDRGLDNIYDVEKYFYISGCIDFNEIQFR